MTTFDVSLITKLPLDFVDHFKEHSKFCQNKHRISELLFLCVITVSSLSHSPITPPTN